MAVVFRGRRARTDRGAAPALASHRGSALHQGRDPLLHGDPQGALRGHRGRPIGGEMKRLAALLLAAGLLAGACGGDSGPDPEADPKGALVSAFEKLTQSEGIAMEISFDATAESL